MVDVYVHVSPSGKAYVGFSVKGMRRRWSDHVSDARRGSPYLFHRAIRKYGASAFTSAVLEQCESMAEACAAERRWIALLETQSPSGYNCTQGGEGVRPSAATRAKMRARQLGKVLSPEHRAKIAAVRRGTKLSPETRAKLSAAGKGRARPDLLGQKQTDEHRAKISASLVGNKRGLGYRHTAEAVAKISSAGARRKGEKRATWSAERHAKQQAYWTPERRAERGAAAALRNRENAGTITLGSTRIKAGL